MSGPREGRWIAKPLRPVWGLWDVDPYGSPMIQFVLFIAILVSPGRGTRLIVILGLILFTVVLLAIKEICLRWPRRRLRALLDRPAELDQTLAIVTVIVEGRRIGADRGVVWFADGALGFSGD